MYFVELILSFFLRKVFQSGRRGLANLQAFKLACQIPSIESYIGLFFEQNLVEVVSCTYEHYT
jgi:hypothetical protein